MNDINNGTHNLVLEDKIRVVFMLFDSDIESTEDAFIIKKLSYKKEEFNLLYDYYLKTGNHGALNDLESQLARYYNSYLEYPVYDGITGLWPNAATLQ